MEGVTDVGQDKFPQVAHTKRKGFLTDEHKKEFKHTLELELKRNY